MSQFNIKPLCIAISLVFTATAQSYAETNQTKKDIVDLGTTVVIGEKMGRTIQETVSSVSITTATEIEDSSSLNDMTNILDKTPNVYATSDTGFSIRGISRGGPTFAGDADTYSVIVDGAVQNYIASQPGVISTWDMEQVEILRGPQSTTSGRNALAGAIVLQSKKPEFVQGGKVQAGYGSDNTYQIAIANTGAITDNLAYRISLENKHTDGFTKNTELNKDDWNSRDNTTVRGKLLYKVNDKHELMLTASNTKYDRDGSRASVNPQKRISEDNTPVFFDTKSTNTSLEYNGQLADKWQLKSTTAYHESTFDRSSDADSKKGTETWNNARNADNFSQEFLFSYNGDKKKNEKLKAVLGLYASNGQFTNNVSISRQTLPFRGSLLPVSFDNTTKDEYDNYAAFFNADYKLTPQLTFLSGLRFDYDKRNNVSNPVARLVGTTGSPAQDAQIRAFLSQAASRTEDDFTSKVWLPKLGFNYEWSDNLSTGVLYQKGYRPGGASINSVERDSKAFDPEFTDNYELSLRMTDDAKKFTLAANLFYTDWKNQQVSVQAGNIPIPDDSYVENAGKSHLYGAEIESTLEVTPRLALSGGLGIVRTKFDEFNDNGTDYNGKEFPDARKLSANLGATYRHLSGWFIGGNAVYQGKGWNDVANTEKLDAYTLVNLKAGYEADSWGAYAHINNAFDKTYIKDTLGSFFAGNGEKQHDLGDPRTFGVTVNYEW